MPKSSPPPNPTAGELAILQVLWKVGPSTVRTVHEILDARRKTGYTTVLKLMQIMAQKGLVTRDESRKTHIYRPCFAEAKTERQLVRDLVDRVFGGSAKRLVLRALEEEKVSSDELARIREVLENTGGGKS